MRKLFVLFLLVALVPFTVGCNGLWDFDDDDDPVATTQIKLARTFPAGSLATKGATVPYIEDLTYVIDGITMVYSSHTIDDNGNYVIVFKATVPTTTYNALQTKAAAGTTVAAQLKLGTNVLATETAATLPTSIPTSTTSDTAVAAAPQAITVAVTVDATTIADIVTPFKVTTVTFGGANVSTDKAAPTTVNSQTPTFTVTFDAAPVDPTTATFEVLVTNLTNNNSYTLTTVAQGGLTVAPVTGQNAVTIAVGTNATIGKTLLTGKNYKIALIKTNLKNAASTPLTIPTPYFITTNF